MLKFLKKDKTEVKSSVLVVTDLNDNSVEPINNFFEHLILESYVKMIENALKQNNLFVVLFLKHETHHEYASNFGKIFFKKL